MRGSSRNILGEIAEVARLHLGWEGDLQPSLRLVEDLELDSLKGLTLALELENHFRVRLDQEAGLETVGDLVAAIERHLSD